MALPTPVNGQITDAITQANLSVAGNAPAVALANLYLGAAQSMATLLQNAVLAQQQDAVVAQAATASCVASLLGPRAVS